MAATILSSGLNLVKHEAFRIWGGFAAVALTIFWAFSSGHFSFVLTLSSLVSVFSFSLVAVTVATTKNVKGVSSKMMECYIAVFASRLCAILPYEGYLPFDRSGDWLYQSCEAIGLIIAAVIVYFTRLQFSSTYDAEADGFNRWWILVPSAGIALIMHPHLAGFQPADVAWAFALYLESVTVLPQFIMFMKEGRAQAHISHFLAAQALSRLLSTIFWGGSFTELATTDHRIKQYVGHWVVAVQLIQLIIMADFIYHYIRAIQKGIPIADVLDYSSNV